MRRIILALALACAPCTGAHAANVEGDVAFRATDICLVMMVEEYPVRDAPLAICTMKYQTELEALKTADEMMGYCRGMPHTWCGPTLAYIRARWGVPQ